MKRWIEPSLMVLVVIAVYAFFSVDPQLTGKYTCYNCLPDATIYLDEKNIYMDHEKTILIGKWENDKHHIKIFLNKKGSAYLGKYLYVESQTGYTIDTWDIEKSIFGLSFSVSADGAIFAKVK